MDPFYSGFASARRRKKRLLALALFLLSDANLELLLLHVLIGFVIVASHGVRQIRIYVGVFGQHSHHGEGFIARRTERPEPFDVRNCHTKIEYHRRARAVRQFRKNEDG
jgi:hypothetical protein